MFIGPDAAKRLQEYLIPRYNQAAKAYNNLSGKNTFEPIPIDKTLYEKYVKPVGTAINQYVLSPIEVPRRHLQTMKIIQHNIRLCYRVNAPPFSVIAEERIAACLESRSP